MDITTITDLNELKALAYDQLRLLELAQNNLQLVESRIATVKKELAEKEIAEQKK